MSVLYIETSALLSWMLGETRGAEVRERITRAETVVTSSLTAIEAHRAVTRAEQESVVTAKNAQVLRGLLRRALAEWIEMEITGAVRDRAGRPFPKEPMRTLDAIHLATALEFTQAFPEIALLSFDGRIRDNAGALGLPLAP